MIQKYEGLQCGLQISSMTKLRWLEVLKHETVWVHLAPGTAPSLLIENPAGRD